MLRHNLYFSIIYPSIYPRAYVSTFSVTGPLAFLNTYKILSIAALRALLTVSAYYNIAKAKRAL